MRRKIAFLLAGVMVAGTLTATPFINTVKVSAAVQEENTNLLPNGNFDEVSESWNGWGNDGGETTIAQKDGALVCDIDALGENPWSVQAVCNSGFCLYKGGEYRLTFDISSTAARTLKYGIQENGGDYTAYVDDTITVNEETQTVSIGFKMKEDTDLTPALFFNMGNYGEELDAHTITIDNATLELVDASGIEETGSTDSKYQENVNIIPNGTFDEVSDSWNGWVNDGAAGVFEQKDGALVFRVDELGPNPWSAQTVCNSGFGLYQGGKYRLTFDISSTVGRTLAYGIQQNGGDYKAYVSDNITVDEETQTVSVNFTMSSETDLAPALFFNIGNYGEELDSHTITIDNVDLELIDASGIKKDTVKKQEENVNLIKSGDFEGDTSDWSHYTTEGGEGVFSTKTGALNYAIQSIGDLEHSVQASCGSGFTLYQNGKYRLKFDISSTVARELKYGIQLNGGDYHAYVSDQIRIDEDVQTVTVDFDMIEATDRAPALFFNMGNYGDALDAHTVTIDNVDLELIDGSAIVYEDEEEKENPININQIGYKTDAQKIAVIRGENVGDTFKVVNAEDDSVVFEGAVTGGEFDKNSGENDYAGDFSSVTEPGTYYIEVEGLGTSYQFQIGDDIFQDVLKDSFRLFYLQRCGEAISEEMGGNFAHGDCHQAKARIYGTDEFIDVSGGWHDAGDYGRYVVATSKAVADLLLAYQANPDAFTDNLNIPESGNGQSDMLDEIYGQLEWLMKMQDPESGGVHHKVTTANFPGSIAADEETAELIVTPISTTATGDFAAVMGMGYEAFKDVNPEFAETCLAAGEKAFDYLADKPNTAVGNPAGIATGEYGDSNDSDERYWAAASLFKATGDETYNDIFKAYVAKAVKSEYGWQTVGSYGNKIYLTCENQDEETAQAIKDAVTGQAYYFLDLAKKDGYGIANGNNYYWGSNMMTLNNASVLMDAYEITGNEEFLTCAKEHVNYVLGKNAVGTSYVTGFGTVSPQNPHHRPSFVAGEAIKGALVGGPNKQLEDNYAKAYLQDKAPAKCYLDHAESYSTNEVDIYWNSPLVRALAEMKFVDNADKIADVDVKADVDTQIEANVMKQNYQITVAGDKTVDTSKLTLRYYFSSENAENLKFTCDYAGVLYNDNPWYHQFKDSVSGNFVKTNAGYYLEIALDEAEVINPEEGTLTVMTRLNNADWTSIDSISNGKVLVYYDGKLVK